MKVSIILKVIDGKAVADIFPKNSIFAEAIENICKNVSLAMIKGKDLKFFDDNGNKIVLKNYRNNIDIPIFRYVVNKVPNDLTVVNNIKIRPALIAIILKGALALTAFSLTNNFKSKKDVKEKITSSEGLEILNNEKNITIIDQPLQKGNSDYILKNNFTAKPSLKKESIKKQEQLEVIEEKVQLITAFDLGWRVTDYAKSIMDDFINSTNFSYFLINAKMFNVDPYLLLAVGMNESGLQMLDNRYASGVMQIEKSLIGSTVTAFNYEINQDETVNIDYNNLSNIDTNVKLAAMMLQNRLNEYNNNVYLTLQSYNYGPNVMNNIIRAYAKEKDITEEDVINNKEDVGFLAHVQNAHYNPNHYGVINWTGTYGNKDYINSVLGFYIGTSLVNENVKLLNN